MLPMTPATTDTVVWSGGSHGLARSKETRIHSIVSDKHPSAAAGLDGQIMQRLLFNPTIDPTTGNPIPGTDRSVRAYFHAVSSGLADLDVVVLPATNHRGNKRAALGSRGDNGRPIEIRGL